MAPCSYIRKKALENYIHSECLQLNILRKRFVGTVKDDLFIFQITRWIVFVYDRRETCHFLSCKFYKLLLVVRYSRIIIKMGCFFSVYEQPFNQISSFYKKFQRWYLIWNLVWWVHSGVYYFIFSCSFFKFEENTLENWKYLHNQGFCYFRLCCVFVLNLYLSAILGSDLFKIRTV